MTLFSFAQFQTIPLLLRQSCFKMRKVFAFAAVASLLTFAACGEKKSPESAAQDTTAVAPEAAAVADSSAMVADSAAAVADSAAAKADSAAKM